MQLILCIVLLIAALIEFPPPLPPLLPLPLASLSLLTLLSLPCSSLPSLSVCGLCVFVCFCLFAFRFAYVCLCISVCFVCLATVPTSLPSIPLSSICRVALLLDYSLQASCIFLYAQITIFNYFPMDFSFTQTVSDFHPFLSIFFYYLFCFFFFPPPPSSVCSQLHAKFVSFVLFDIQRARVEVKQKKCNKCQRVKETRLKSR